MNFKEQRDNFRTKKVSAKEAVQESIKKVNGDNLNIFINTFQTEALKQAEYIDNNFDIFISDKFMDPLSVAVSNIKKHK